MKRTLLLLLVSLSGSVFAGPKVVLYKRSDDPCPKGRHEVEVTEVATFVEKKDDGDNPAQIKETRKVCRSNSQHKIKERK